jgi:hypothetical protein
VNVGVLIGAASSALTGENYLAALYASIGAVGWLIAGIRTQAMNEAEAQQGGAP